MAELPRNNPKKAMLSAVIAGALTLGFAGMMAKSCAAPVKQQQEPANPALEMVDTLASRLVLGLDTDATLQYATPSGTIVTVSQSAPRRAYRSGGVTYISTPDGTFLCSTAAAPSPAPAKSRKPVTPAVKCQEGPGADTMSPTEAKAISAAFGGEFLAPEAALGRLATIAQGDGVRAGASKRGDAQCVSVTATGIRTEMACVNPAGLLAYFQGTTDAGKATELVLQYTTPSVSEEAFLPPSSPAPAASKK
ncbi:hypothetical protein [Dactylosporangium matsuzakiense]|uniref:Lipoprotein n=1 Tax=Dactylosporangium matsuzakiense TaxID=53360 RepID=A0A9W6NMZ4_9ACTN|nr:hypothetical protein [Dactylosporangium matsuzakiense]UWZ43462.1 hypothetical protein Dmats_39360 [Dactylosporangium matsuzakiense]GLL02954.1 hypothetical protein GCM10017581_046960 [Dactylosporangium matsuzakiense]